MSEPFVKSPRPAPHRYSDACACQACTETFRRAVRSNGSNPHMYGAVERPLMSWAPILSGLAWTLLTACVVLVILLAAGVVQWPRWLT